MDAARKGTGESLDEGRRLYRVFSARVHCIVVCSFDFFFCEKNTSTSKYSSAPPPAAKVFSRGGEGAGRRHRALIHARFDLRKRSPEPNHRLEQPEAAFQYCLWYTRCTGQPRSVRILATVTPATTTSRPLRGSVILATL